MEPIRRRVNRLLERADPILIRYRRRQLSPRDARRGLSALQARFAIYSREIATVRPVPAELAATHRAYSHAYSLEDAYLRALAAAIPSRHFDSLPETEDAQRAAIVAWRRRLQAEADRLDLPLPADVQSAGKGEIAPSPLGE